MAPSKLRTAETRARILGAAERLFAEQGFDRVTMPMIAEASGITAGAIYRHFESKADLFFEVVRGAVQAAPAAAPDPGGIAGGVAAFTGRRMRRVRQLAVEMHAASTRDDKVARFLRQALDRQIGEMGAAIAAEQASGSMDAALDPVLAGNLVFVLIMGLMHAETLNPALVGDPAWRAFVAARVAAMLGARG